MENLINKYLNDTLTQEEYDRLLEGLKDPAQREIFEKQVRDHYHLLRATVDPDPEEGYRKVWQHIDRYKRSEEQSGKEIVRPVAKLMRRISGNHWYAYAAAVAIALVLALGYFFRQGTGNRAAPDFSKLIPATDDIVLELADGSYKVIEPGDTKAIVDAHGVVLGQQDENILDFTGEMAVRSSGEAQYNTLLVPYGQRFEVLLSDGTQVFLQAGSSLRFPVRFDGLDFRNVLVEGEAFFKVAKDTEHPFIVEAQGLQVTVTGTQFNVTAYPEDPLTDVVLVEGGVQLTAEENDPMHTVKMNPGEKASLDRKSLLIETEEVNTELYTSWMEGALVFRQMPFDQIEKKLERYYNIEIINENRDLGGTVFNAHFKNETISNVLSFFGDSYDLTFEVEENKVYIR